MWSHWEALPVFQPTMLLFLSLVFKRRNLDDFDYQRLGWKVEKGSQTIQTYSMKPFQLVYLGGCIIWLFI